MKLHTLFISISLLFISMSAHAAQWYHVELIVFEQLDTVTDEQWPEMDKKVTASFSPSSNNSLIHSTGVSTLVNDAARLNRSSKYRVHYHRAWQQPIMRKRSAKSVKVGSGMLDGKIRLYKSTYLHAALDLWLLENKPLTATFVDDENYLTSDTLVRNPHLEESRRIRTKKLYFFDHPKLGALLKIVPIKSPASQQQSEQSLETFSLPSEAVAIVSE
ncbi:MAG: hypothetical protein COA90_03305 [Gammaproteobacteria bacterium]|nr:MAG: hypothetical protein COA90_03305 [Gammaproteobacteria bacterium]